MCKMEKINQAVETLKISTPEVKSWCSRYIRQMRQSLRTKLNNKELCMRDYTRIHNYLFKLETLMEKTFKAEFREHVRILKWRPHLLNVLEKINKEYNEILKNNTEVYMLNIIHN